MEVVLETEDDTSELGAVVEQFVSTLNPVEADKLLFLLPNYAARHQIGIRLNHSNDNG